MEPKFAIGTRVRHRYGEYVVIKSTPGPGLLCALYDVGHAVGDYAVLYNVPEESLSEISTDVEKT